MWKHNEKHRLTDRGRQSSVRLQWVSSIAALVFATITPAKAEPGVFDDRVLFGQSAAFEGPAASLGTAFRDGLTAAFKEANRTGGVHGRQLELTSYDDGYEPERAIANTNRLIADDEVFALIGEVGTPTSRAAQPIAEKKGVPFVGPFSGAAFLRNSALNTVVNMRASYDQEAEALVDYLTTDLGYDRIAILYQDDTFGLAGLNGLTAALQDRGLEPVADGTYRRNTTAVKRALLTIRRANPQAVIIVGAYKPTAVFIKTARDIGLDVTFAALSFVGGKALSAELAPGDNAVLVSQVVPLFNDHNLPLAKRFQDALAASAPEAEAGFVALEGYVVGRMAIETLERLGEQPTRESFLALFQNPATFDIDGLELSFDAGDNQGSDRVFLTEIRPDGSFAAVDRAE
ncbi:MAG: ABC transporter substrate-binding protein [Alphaproteobacteria bacterium]|nr:ABC transporter substrate-binding protein [Alphaproteobacteria bacterium]